MDTLSLIMAFIALMIASLAYFPNRHFLRRARELDEIEKLQTEWVKDKSNKSPDVIKARIRKDSSGNEVLTIENITNKALFLEELKQTHGGSCIPEYEIREHFPIREFLPGQALDIPVFIDIDTIPVQTFTLTWRNEKKSRYTKIYNVSVL